MLIIVVHFGIYVYLCDLYQLNKHYQVLFGLFKGHIDACYF